MKSLEDFWKKQSAFVILAVVIAFLLNFGCMLSSDSVDHDPLFGSSDCIKYGETSLIKWIANSFGLWILLNVGAYFKEEDIKKDFKTWTRKNILGWHHFFEEMEDGK